MNKEQCKGCLSFEEGGGDCYQGVAHISDECPCATCLVKMICDEGCDLYKAYDESDKDYDENE